MKKENRERVHNGFSFSRKKKELQQKPKRTVDLRPKWKKLKQKHATAGSADKENGRKWSEGGLLLILADTMRHVTEQKGKTWGNKTAGLPPASCSFSSVVA